MKVVRKTVCKTKIDIIINQNKSENPAVSNLLMSGWEEEENGTNM